MTAAASPSPARIALLTVLAVFAFAGNSLLCRAALADGAMDTAGFTLVRLLSGAIVLALLVRMRATDATGHGSWASALALFAYAAGRSRTCSSRRAPVRCCCSARCRPR